MTTQRAILLSSMLATVVTLVQSAQAAPAYKILKQAVYAEIDGATLSLDVVVPTGKTNGLGIVDVASGAGHVDRAKISDADQARIAEILCGRGYTLFVVKPGPTTKYSVIDMADHVQRAIVFVKNNADNYKIDPDALGLLSTGAGVHLVALVAVTATGETAVKAAGVYFPPTDYRQKDVQKLYIQSDNKAWEEVSQQAFPGIGIPALSASDDVEAAARNPQTKMPDVSPNCPRFLIVHGNADPFVPRNNSNLFFGAMRDAGRATDLTVKRPGGDPGPTIRAEVTTLANWFDKQLTPE